MKRWERQRKDSLSIFMGSNCCEREINNGGYWLRIAVRSEKDIKII